jgi:hypothetical protein
LTQKVEGLVWLITIHDDGIGDESREPGLGMHRIIGEEQQTFVGAATLKSSGKIAWFRTVEDRQV